MMTLREYASIVATSSALAERTAPPPAAAAASPPAPAFGAAPNAPNKTLPSERFIARRPSSVVSSVPDAPTSVPLMIEHRAVEREAGDRGRHAGERVEQRDDDRHVGAADGQHAEHAEQQRRDDDAAERRERDVAREHVAGESEDREQHEAVDELLPGIGDGPARHQFLQLGESDETAGEADRADDRAEDDRQQLIPCGRAAGVS